MLYSPASLGKRLLAIASLALLTAIPATANALTLTSQTNQTNEASISQSASTQQWLMADKDDDDDKKGRNKDRGRGRDDDDDDRREVRVDLNRAKNLARQAAESANGGIRVYRAENSMHGPASQCPYVDNGDSWTFTFLGGRPGVTTRTIESVVTVYKTSPRVVVAYNGAVRSVQQTRVQSFTSSQRTVLVDLMRGNCSNCNYLVSNSLRTQIVNQGRSLPPGIQKQLLRGKGLPPGIAKKLVPLPKQVNTYINLPSYYDLVVVGSNIVLIDQVNTVVVDYISYIL
ncbi:hypothetical protein JOY44_19345 [Phormidium sp. CLA17]|uniref:hypothetical protein n=1 Tax=Leptolyngbya sp. Cla-17 TaxID=2803751 RepID=UPI001490E9B3|nr:hypothetical protein [Leptolyngbya sp. Cla-17]MBM0743746.1 hypothetical protein [Leptolyngbya sp. Cla-17]